LIATSRTPKARQRPVACWLRKCVRAYPGHSDPDFATRRWLKTIWPGSGLLALVLLTTCAVAWVSAWWVPAYLALMTLIFVMPAGRGQSARVSGPSAGGIFTDQTTNLGVKSADEGIHLHAAELASSVVGGEQAAESADCNPQTAHSTMAKLRRGRGRVRRVARTTAEPSLNEASVAWIRVGPGQFVRADVSSQVTSQAKSDDVVAALRPATDEPAVLPARLAFTDAQGELGLSTTLETASGEAAVVNERDRYSLGSVTEEHGIAPSAFGSNLTTSVENVADEVAGAAAVLGVDPSSMATVGENTPADGMDLVRPPCRRSVVRRRVARLVRGIAKAIRGPDQACVGREVPTGRELRGPARSSFAPSLRVKQAAIRALDRTPRMRRAFRPRSPPCR